MKNLPQYIYNFALFNFINKKMTKLAISTLVLIIFLLLTGCKSDLSWSELMSKFDELIQENQYSEALKVGKQAVEAAETEFGQDHQNTLMSMDNLAAIFLIQKQYAQAESLYTLVLATKEKEVGGDHSDIVPSLKNLAGLYLKKGELKEAEYLYGRVLKIDETALGLGNPSVASDLSNLAEIYVYQDRFSDAEILYKR